jgi:plasmid stabilization system protein ParE
VVLGSTGDGGGWSLVRAVAGEARYAGEPSPSRCSLAAESEQVGQEIRELLLGGKRYKYRILFKISGKLVVILRVWHGARDSIAPEELAE